MDEAGKSTAYMQRARRVLPGGVNSNIRLLEKPYPLTFTRGRGAILEDVDGRTYIDYVCGMGPVILEPILCNTGVIPPKPGYLEAIRAWCDGEGAVLIFDEVITGFRVALGGAQALLGITPDLTVFGKAIANGFPLSAVGGRRDLMEVLAGGVLHGGTYNGNPPAMAAARATLHA